MKKVWIIVAAVAAVAVGVAVFVVTRPERLTRVAATRALGGGEALVVAIPVGSEAQQKDKTLQLALLGEAGVRWSTALPGDRGLLQTVGGPRMSADAERVYALFWASPGESGAPRTVELSAYDRKTGARAWAHPFAVDEKSDFGRDEDVVADRGSLLVVGGGTLSALDPATGAERWHVTDDGATPAGLRLGASTVALVGGEGTALYARADGHPLGRLPLVGRVCQLGEALFGATKNKDEAVLATFDPATPPRVVPNLSLSPQRCAQNAGRIVAFDRTKAAAIDVAAGTVAWMTRTDLQRPEEVVDGADADVVDLGEIGVAQLIADPRHDGNGRWLTLDCATGTLGQRDGKKLGATAVGSSWVVGQHLAGGDATTARQVLFDRDGKPVAAWKAGDLQSLQLRPWSVADGRLWLVDPRRIASLDDVSWTVVDLASGKPVAGAGSEFIDWLPAGTVTPSGAE
ncbi:MAG: PQQ-binding-like beta-propeller repeat protein [Myxococcota bacterium]